MLLSTSRSFGPFLFLVLLVVYGLTKLLSYISFLTSQTCISVGIGSRHSKTKEYVESRRGGGNNHVVHISSREPVDKTLLVPERPSDEKWTMMIATLLLVHWQHHHLH